MSARGKYQRIWHIEVRSRHPKTRFDREWQCTGRDWGHIRKALIEEIKELRMTNRNGQMIYRVRRYCSEHGRYD
jgi:hypothetical protein